MFKKWLEVGLNGTTYGACTTSTGICTQILIVLNITIGTNGIKSTNCMNLISQFDSSQNSTMPPKSRKSPEEPGEPLNKTLPDYFRLSDMLNDGTINIKLTALDVFHSDPSWKK